MLSEYWEQGSNKQLFDTNPCCWTGHYLNWLNLADAAQLNGADFFGGFKGTATSTTAMQYGRASFYLVWNGKGGGLLWMSTDGSDPWHPAWTTYIGTPLAARYTVGVGLRRDYTNGTALVNPNAFSAQTYNLGGSYITPSGSTVTTVTLQPITAMVLKKTTATHPRHRHRRRPRRRPRLRRPASTSSWWARQAASASPLPAPPPRTGHWSSSPAAPPASASTGGWSPPATATTSSSTATAASASTSPPSRAPTAPPVQQWGCWSGDQPAMEARPVETGYYQIVGKASGKCLDVTAQSLAEGAQLQIWGCWNGANQRFRMPTVS